MASETNTSWIERLRKEIPKIIGAMERRDEDTKPTPTIIEKEPEPEKVTFSQYIQKVEGEIKAALNLLNQKNTSIPTLDGKEREAFTKSMTEYADLVLKKLRDAPGKDQQMTQRIIQQGGIHKMEASVKDWDRLLQATLKESETDAKGIWVKNGLTQLGTRLPFLRLEDIKGYRSQKANNAL